MWIILLLIVIAVIGKFIYDNFKHTSAMKKDGGMAVKYAELVDACLTCSGAGILQETLTFISIGGKYTEHGITINYAFWIQHTFNNKLIVKYVLKGPNMPQKVVRQWDFNQTQPQQQMVHMLRECLDELKTVQSHIEDADRSKFISHKYSTLIQRLKMEGANNFNLYKIEVIKDTLLEYEFKLNMKFACYNYVIRFWHGSGKLQVILNSTNFINGKWEFPLNMEQSAMAGKIETDIDEMVTKHHDSTDFYG